MSTSLREIIRVAAHCISCLSKIADGDLKGGVRTRARQLFEILMYQGLPYLFAYVGGKATERALHDLYVTICKDADLERISGELQEVISKYRLSREDASYGLYGASLMCIISRILKRDLKCSLEELIYNYGFDRTIQKIAYEAAKWLKFFAEAKLTM